MTEACLAPSSSFPKLLENPIPSSGQCCHCEHQHRRTAMDDFNDRTVALHRSTISRCTVKLFMARGGPFACNDIHENGSVTTTISPGREGATTKRRAGEGPCARHGAGREAQKQQAPKLVFVLRLCSFGRQAGQIATQIKDQQKRVLTLQSTLSAYKLNMSEAASSPAWLQPCPCKPKHGMRSFGEKAMLSIAELEDFIIHVGWQLILRRLHPQQHTKEGSVGPQKLRNRC